MFVDRSVNSGDPVDLIESHIHFRTLAKLQSASNRSHPKQNLLKRRI